MSEEIIETLAQLQHKNLKLLDELNHLREHTLSMEDTLNSQYSELHVKRRRLKSLEQQNDHLNQLTKEKDILIDLLEQDKKNLTQLNTELSSEKLLLKGDLLKEKLKNKQLEEFRTKEDDLKNEYDQLKQEHQRLIFELSFKSEECLSSAATIKDLLLIVKELEDEKAEFLAVRDTLMLRENEGLLKTSENLECFLRKSPEWSKSQMYHNATSEQDLTSPSFSREKLSLNLCEEILEVELQEKQIKIGQLENLLRRKEEEELERNQTIAELKRELNNAGLLNYNSKIDLRLDSSAFYNIHRHLLKLLNWPEGHSGECKAVAEVASHSIVVKDGVQATQPSTRVVETISIASQTDPVKNLPPVSPFKSSEKSLPDFIMNQPFSDSDDENEESFSFIDGSARKNLRLFTENKNCNLDMDIYRSCRKLSVLLEEDIDESFSKKSCLKKNNPYKFCPFNLKAQSVDDITKMKSVKPLLEKTYSYLNISSSNGRLDESVESFCKQPNSWNTNFGNTITENLGKPNDKMDNTNEEELVIVSPSHTIRQPYSFDSYLDFVKTPSSPVAARQISDSVQHTDFPALTRKGSHIRKPKSTCRPLRLPCGKTEKIKEERVSKVRFDLNGMEPKKDSCFLEKKDASTALNNTKKIKIVSRFRVEIIDEIEFRKSLEENSKNLVVNRKRSPLLRSVIYKKSVLRDLTNFGEKIEPVISELQKVKNFSLESSSSTNTFTEGLPTENFDADSQGYHNYLIDDQYSLKRRRQSNISCNSFEDSQDSSEGSDILMKSIKLHTNSDCIVMKELRKEHSDSSVSKADSEIPYIDSEDLPVIKPSFDTFKFDPGPEILISEARQSNFAVFSPGSHLEGSDVYFTPSDVTPASENNEIPSLGTPKSSDLSKSPTVLKNLSNFELLISINESKKLALSEEKKTEELFDNKRLGSIVEERNLDRAGETESSIWKRASSDISEASESDALTYSTVKSQMVLSSDGDSDTYVTVWSDKSFDLERKFSDLSENSSSPYNTPPDTSSASFCTPPDTYSPVLDSLKKHSGMTMDKSCKSLDKTYLEKNNNLFNKSDPPSSLLPHEKPCRLISENNKIYSRVEVESFKFTEINKNGGVIFESPKLEFYETNDSVENLEAFLKTEENLECELKSQLKKKQSDWECFSDVKYFETEDLVQAFSIRNNRESPKLSERRGKKHPMLSRQNSTEEYIFLDPHESCLNLSEEISSPSTTPDTSNKTIIFKNIPLTIDLEDDFSTSEIEFHVNYGGSQTENLKNKEVAILRYSKDAHCLSEPCSPSISSSDFLQFSDPRRQTSSFTDETLVYGKFEAYLPEIVVSNLSSDSEISESDMAGYAEMEFASNVSDRSEVHLSDVNSISGRSDNSCSFSEHSDKVVSDVFISDSEKSSAASRDLTRNSSSSDKTQLIENSFQDLAKDQLPSNSPTTPVAICDGFSNSSEANPGILGLVFNISHREGGEVSSCDEDIP